MFGWLAGHDGVRLHWPRWPRGRWVAIARRCAPALRAAGHKGCCALRKGGVALGSSGSLTNGCHHLPKLRSLRQRWRSCGTGGATSAWKPWSACSVD